MLRPVPLLLCLSMTLSGCATVTQSRLNPLNWFGGSTGAVSAPASAPTGPLVPANRQAATVDLRTPVAQIAALRVDPTPSGIIVTATGLAAGPGYFNAALVPVGASGGVLTFEMRAEAPVVPAPGGTPTISVAVPLSSAELGGISRIEVRGQTNALTAAR